MRSLILFLCLLLIGGYYVSVLAIASQPRISPTYKAFYIDQRLLFWPGTTGLDYTWSEEIPLNTNSRYLQKGWSHRERAGRWTNGNSAGFAFALPDFDSASYLSFELQIDRPAITKDHPEQQIVLRTNGVLLAQYSLTSSDETVLVAKIPVDLVAAEDIFYLDIEITDCLDPRPERKDRRCLGIFATSARLSLQ